MINQLFCIQWFKKIVDLICGFFFKQTKCTLLNSALVDQSNITTIDPKWISMTL